ncbi:MAG: hypothetical protein ACE5HN_09545, partial [Nitrospiria bacterium]
IIRSTIRWVALCRRFDTKIIDGIVNALGRRIFSPNRWVALCRRFDLKVIDGIVNGFGRTVLSGGWLSTWFEKYVIYGFLNLTGYANHLAARILRRLQTGTVNHYAMMIIIGIFILVNLYLILKSQLPALIARK